MCVCGLCVWTVCVWIVCVDCVHVFVCVWVCVVYLCTGVHVCGEVGIGCVLCEMSVQGWYIYIWIP